MLVEVLTNIQNILTQFPLVITTFSSISVILISAIAIMQKRPNIIEMQEIIKTELIQFLSLPQGQELYAKLRMLQGGIKPDQITPFLDIARAKRILPKFLWWIPYKHIILKKYQKYKWASLIHGAFIDLTKDGFNFDAVLSIYHEEVIDDILKFKNKTNK